MKTLFTFISLFLCLTASASELRTAPAPQGADLKHDFEVAARIPGGQWKPLDTYLMQVDEVKGARHNVRKVSGAKFEFSGTVELRVISKTQHINSYQVRPLSYRIPVNNLHIFADTLMNKPKAKKRDLIYFGPGIHDFHGDSIAVASGKTVFLDQGAVVKGWFSVYNAHNVRILGHGLVMPGHHEGIMVRYSKNILIDGPLTTQIPVGGSDSVEVRNCKVMSWYGWGDGFNIFASSNIRQHHLFARTSDDCSTIYCTRKGYHGSSRNIDISDAIYWADVAHPIMIGLHSQTEEQEEITNVRYADIDILNHAENQIDYQGCIGINDGDDILVHNMLFDNIHIENIRKGMLFNFRVCFNRKYCTAPGRGIEDITLRNVSYTGSEPNMSIIAGYDDNRRVRNIRFENLVVNGKKISDDMSGKPKWYKTSDMFNCFIGEHVDNITFK